MNKAELNRLFIDDLKGYYDVIGDCTNKPIIVFPLSSRHIQYKVYIFNCTNPPGGRSLGEYKIQLIIPEQKHGQRGHFDESDGSTVLIVGFAIYDTTENGVWVIWETDFHRDFAYSSNLQVKMETIIDSITNNVFSVKKRGNGETIVVSDRKHLAQAIRLRQRIDLEKLLKE